jgi:hypothetical protein
MNGSVPSSSDLTAHNELRRQVKQWKKVFYYGDELSPLELDIERMYLQKKIDKHASYEKRKSMRFKVRWTISDLNKY